MKADDRRMRPAGGIAGGPAAAPAGGRPSRDLDGALAALRDLLGERLSTSPSVLDLHGRDESSFAPALPDAVAFPRTTEEVAAVVRACAEHALPVIPFGTGSSLEGHILATHGGVSVDTSLMDRIVRVSVADLDATVQPGVRRTVLEKRLGGDGLFFSVDPGADASLGGMAATSASGTNTVRYGTMRENVLTMQVVLADGTVIDTGTRARKTSAGYDLTHLFVGSEGTLGIITELTLRLRPIPEAISAAICSFPSTHDAVATAIATVQAGVPVARCEMRPRCARSTRTRSSSTARRRRCSSSSTGRPAASRRTPATSRSSRVGTAAATSSGRCARRTAAGSGARATMPTSPRSACGPAAARSRPTSAFPCRRWRARSTRP